MPAGYWAAAAIGALAVIAESLAWWLYRRNVLRLLRALLDELKRRPPGEP